MGFGSWLRDRPRLLEAAYGATHRLFESIEPIVKGIGFQRMERLIKGPEELGKGVVFDCRMCGQCILHSTGMTCPMTCPKTLRNGPCGGVRPDGYCEVKPEMRCVWVEAFERSQKMGVYGEEIRWLQPPVNRELEGRSAWITMLTGEDKDFPVGWQRTNPLEVLADDG